MASTASAYGILAAVLSAAGLNYLDDDITVALCDDSYVPNQDTHEVVDDLSGELTDMSYGRQLVTGKLVDYDSGTNVYMWTGDDVEFPTLTGSDIQFAVFFKDTGDDSTAPLIGWIDFGAGQSVVAQDFVVDIPPAGIVQITAL